jgi:hypothetical protein
MENAEQYVPKQLARYFWKKCQPGYPTGRPSGKTLKEFAREYLMSLPDDENRDQLYSGHIKKIALNKRASAHKSRSSNFPIRRRTPYRVAV